MSRHDDEALRLSEERMRLMIESVRDYAIFMLDPDGRVASWNAGAERIKGYTADEIIGHSFSRFYTEEDRARRHPDEVLELAMANGSYSEEGWRVRKNGDRFWASVVVTAVFDAQRHLRGFAKVSRDMTEPRRMQEEAIAAQMRAVEAQTGVRIRDEFMSAAAHELRTPLAALQLKLESAVLLLEKSEALHRDPALAKVEERVAGAVRNVERLAELVERMLEMSRIVGGRLALNVEQIDLALVVRQVVADFSEPAKAVGCDLRLNLSPALVGLWDRARVEQVLVSLLSNALKYGGGKPVDITLQQTDTCARLGVMDRGIGIAPDDVERIFARFERAAPFRHYSGLGIGLYVARSIVEAHGGTLHVTSAPGEGATFTVELPWQREARS